MAGARRSQSIRPSRPCDQAARFSQPVGPGIFPPGSVAIGSHVPSGMHFANRHCPDENLLRQNCFHLTMNRSRLSFDGKAESPQLRCHVYSQARYQEKSGKAVGFARSHLLRAWCLRIVGGYVSSFSAIARLSCGAHHSCGRFCGRTCLRDRRHHRLRLPRLFVARAAAGASRQGLVETISGMELFNRNGGLRSARYS